MVSRTQRTPFAEWWWTVDRLTLAAIGALMLAGVVLSLAASPPVAGRLGLDPFYFVDRHILYLIPTVAILLGMSFLNPRQIRRLALIVFAVSLVMVAATPYFGAEIKGARRWLILFGVNIQPSEFLKPAFVILIAWLFGESAKRADMPANAFALLLLLLVVALLVIQPDFGQTMLVVLVWSALFFMAGMRLIWVFGIAGIAGIGLDRRVFHGAACGELASRNSSIRRPATPSISTSPPRASCAAAGSAAARARARSSGCCRRAIPTSCSRWRRKNSASRSVSRWWRSYAFIVIRALARAMRNDDAFTRFAAAGLAILFGMQSAINVAVNLHLIPAKGMTLPFISYGGSSMLSLAYAMGMLLALTREQPRVAMLTSPELATAESV